MRVACLRAALAVIAAAPAAAQVAPAVPSPDRIIEESRRQLEDRARGAEPAPPPRLLEQPAPPPPPAGAADARFRLERVVFDASAYLRAEELAALARLLEGREVGIGELRALVERVNALYAERGIATARAVLPPQDVQGGVVRVVLVEGRIGVVRMNGGSARTGRQAEGLRVAPGTLADPRVLESALRRFNLVNDAQLRAQLAQGEAAGTTDVVLVPEEPRRLGADVFADNSGFESTGRWQAGAVLRGYRLLDDGDRMTLAFAHARGVDSGSASYGAPIAPGVRADLSASVGATRLNAGANRDVRVTGTSRSFGGSVSAVLLARARNTLFAGVGVQNLYSTTDVAGPRVLTNLAWQGSGSLTASHQAPGLAASVQVELAGARVFERVSDTNRTLGLLRGAANLAVALADGVQARGRADWQVALADDLPGFLLYQAGGARSNRAFAPGTAAGDTGVSAAAELAWTKRVGPVGVELLGFFDHAQVRSPGAFASIQGAGVGAGMGAGPLNLRASYAWGVGAKGADTIDRFYVSATARF